MTSRNPSDQSVWFYGDAGGKRLDRLLGEVLSLSRRGAWRLIEQKHVRVNGRLVSPGDKSRKIDRNDRVEVQPFRRPEDESILACDNSAVRELARSDQWLVVEKPPGMPVHPHRPDETGTVMNTVISRFPQCQGIGEGGLRSAVVHRLDVDTSGVLLIALTDSSWLRLREAFKKHRIRKLYSAVVAGRLEGGGSEQMRLAVTQHRPARVRVLNGNSTVRYTGVRQCSLVWRSIRVYPQATLIEVDLGTGFLHQIRAMFSHKGYPLIGDRVYGDLANDTPSDKSFAVNRTMLHARRLQYEEIDVECDVPRDFVEVLSRFESGGDRV